MFNFLAHLVTPFHYYFAPQEDNPQSRRKKITTKKNGRKSVRVTNGHIVIVEPLLDIYIPPTDLLFIPHPPWRKIFQFPPPPPPPPFTTGRHIAFNVRVTIRKRIASSPSLPPPFQDSTRILCPRRLFLHRKA